MFARIGDLGGALSSLIGSPGLPEMYFHVHPVWIRVKLFQLSVFLLIQGIYVVSSARMGFGAAFFRLYSLGLETAFCNDSEIRKMPYIVC